MFDDYIIRKDSLKNDYDKDGNAVGFQLAVRIADYRGAYLSLVNGYYLNVDGVEYPQDAQTFEINGKAPRTYGEIEKAVWEHWDYDDEGIIHVKKAGGLAKGSHKIGIQQSILAAYGYMPWDEEWVKNPPVPGHGAGAGKTDSISWFTLNLQ